MKKIGIVVFHNMKYAPYLKFYTKMLDKMGDITYDVIYFNREKSLYEMTNDRFLSIKWLGKGTNAASKFEKLINFIIYPFKIKIILKRKNYDFLIILMTMPSILLFDYLLTNYPKRYILDIRDYTHENNKIYYNIEKRIINNAAACVISSSGFKSFLPKYDYLICHNLNSYDEGKTNYSKKNELPIIISYIGSISYEDQCISLIKLVENDLRFEFHFYGNESTSSRVSEYIKNNHCTRSKMYGSFEAEEKRNIYMNTDLVFNCYGNDTPLVNYAISNKYYDGALYKTPVLTSPYTIMSEITGEFGYSLDLGKIDNLDCLYDWYVNLDEKRFLDYSTQVIENSKIENKTTEEKIKAIIEKSGIK